MDINLLGSIASLVGVGTTLLQWLLQIRKEGKQATIDEYLEWLRRENHKEVLTAIEGNREVFGALEALINESAEKIDALPGKLAPLIADTETAIMKELSNTESRITVQLAQLKEMLQLLQEQTPTPTPEREEVFEIRPGAVQVTMVIRGTPRELQFGVDVALVNNRATMSTVTKVEAFLELGGRLLAARARLLGSLAIPRHGGAVQVRAESAHVQDMGRIPALIGVRVTTIQDTTPITWIKDERLWNDLVK